MKDKTIHVIFYVSLLLKALNAALELILGALFLFNGTVGTLIVYFAHFELVEDPTDFLANRVMGWLPQLTSGVERFGAYYLLTHGAVKALLVVGLLRRVAWAYPASIVVLFLFILYQLEKYARTGSVLLLVLTAFDALVIWLIWLEYVTHIRRQRTTVTGRH